MGLSEIVDIVTSVGFPIVACAWLANFTKTTIKEFRDSLTANTSVLEALSIRISDYLGGDVHE